MENTLSLGTIRDLPYYFNDWGDYDPASDNDLWNKSILTDDQFDDL